MTSEPTGVRADWHRGVTEEHSSTAVVGTLYAANDNRRDAGFSLFYMGINLGALAGPLLTGLTRSTLGFHYAFGVAAIGMAAGLIQYTIGRRNLGAEAGIVPNSLPRSRWTMVAGAAVVVVAVVFFLVASGLVTAANLSDVVVVLCGVAAVVYFAVILASPKITVAFLLFLPWAGGAGPTTPLLTVVVILLVFALGELLISPVGLSLAAKISPRVFRSQTVALYFLSIALGTALSGSLAGYYSPTHEAPYIGSLGVAAIVVGVIVVALSPMIRRLMAGVH